MTIIIFCHLCALQGLLPNEAEKIELRKMYAPFLNMSDHDEETSNIIINQIYSGDDRGNQGNLLGIDTSMDIMNSMRAAPFCTLYVLLTLYIIYVWY